MADTPLTEPTIVLVHGAWHDASCWDLVVRRLRDRQRQVVTPQNPSSSHDADGRGDLAADVANLREVLDGTSGRKVVVGHSYGGVVVTEATAGRDDVDHLVYLTAFMLDEGESLLAAVGGGMPPWTALVEDGGASVVVGAEHVFYNDVADETQVVASTDALRPQSTASFRDEVGAVGWRDVATTYVVCEQDNAIAPDGQRAMAERADEVTSLDASHSPFLSRPDELATLLRGIG